jgi:hypothetical protein
MHLMGAMSYEHSNTNINDDMKCKVSSNLPLVRNEAVYAQLQVPKWDVEFQRNEGAEQC